MASEKRFGYEWDRYHGLEGNYENQFLNWVSPLSQQDFKGKSVLDAGCGMGRNSYWPLSYGAKEVVAFDFDERSVRRAKDTLSRFENFSVELKSIFKLDFKDRFDIVFSIGVIHHLEDPKLALKNLVLALKPSGKLVVWVYGYEGNEWVVRFVDPVRKNITSKLPVGLVHFLSYFCSIPLWVFIKLFKNTNSYIKQLSSFKFWHIHSIVFDQLIPEIAHYWSKEDVVSLFDGLGLESVDVHAPPNKNGWTIVAVKK